LVASFAATPQVAARIIAENMLLREECRWQRLLDQAEPNAGMTSRRSTAVGATEFVAELHVERLRSARNFFVCGHRVNHTTAQHVVTTMVVTVTVNGIQQKTFTLGPDSNFNLGLINPLVLPGVVNVFRVTVSQINTATGQPCGDASQVVVITHFVLDDESVFVFNKL